MARHHDYGVPAYPERQFEYCIVLRGGFAMDKPYVSAAILCEQILEEKNGSLTLVRIADRVDFSIQGLPSGYTPVIALKGLLSLKSGPVKGDFTIKLIVTRPNGETQGQPMILPKMTFLGGEHGQNAILNISVAIHEEGVYWFDVYFENEPLTRIPLVVKQQIQQQQAVTQ